MYQAPDLKDWESETSTAASVDVEWKEEEEDVDGGGGGGWRRRRRQAAAAAAFSP